jgi:hypothetical protein
MNPITSNLAFAGWRHHVDGLEAYPPTDNGSL